MSKNNLILQMDSETDGLYVFDRDTKTAQRMLGRLKSTSANATTTSYPSWHRSSGGYASGYTTSTGEVFEEVNDHVEWASTIEKINGKYWFIRNVIENTLTNTKRVFNLDLSSSTNPSYPQFLLNDGHEYMLAQSSDAFGGWGTSYSFVRRIDSKNWKGTEETFKDGYATILYRPMFVSQSTNTIYNLKTQTYSIIGYTCAKYNTTDMSLSNIDTAWNFESDDEDVANLKSMSTKIYPGIKLNGTLSDVVLMSSSTGKFHVVTEKSFGTLVSNASLNAELNAIIDNLKSSKTKLVNVYSLPNNKFWIIASMGHNTCIQIENNKIINHGSLFETLNPSQCRSGVVDLYSGLAVLQYLEDGTTSHKIIEKTHAFETNVPEPNYPIDINEYAELTIDEVVDDNGSSVLTHPFDTSINVTHATYSSDKILACNGCSSFLIKKNQDLNFGFSRNGYISQTFNVNISNDTNMTLTVEKGGDLNMVGANFIGAFTMDGYRADVIVVYDDMQMYYNCLVPTAGDLQINGTYYSMYTTDTSGMYYYDSYEGVVRHYEYGALMYHSVSAVYNYYAWDLRSSYGSHSLITVSDFPSTKDTVWFQEEPWYYPEKIGNILKDTDTTSPGFHVATSMETSMPILVPQHIDTISSGEYHCQGARGLLVLNY